MDVNICTDTLGDVPYFKFAPNGEGASAAKNNFMSGIEKQKKQSMSRIKKQKQKMVKNKDKDGKSIKDEKGSNKRP